MRLRILWCLAGFWVFQGLAVADDAGGSAPQPVVLTGKEAELAAQSLLWENEALRAEVRQLQEQVGGLIDKLAEARAKLDLGRSAAGTDGWSVRPLLDAAAVAGRTMRIAEAKTELKLAVVDAGKNAGIRAGMTFYVVREGRPVARLRAVEVRESITGTTVEEIWMEPFPRKGDRVVMGAPSER